MKKKNNNKGAGDYVLSLRPVNEIENLINGIKSFLTDTNKGLYSFEGLEPSLELILERSHKGYSATCWVDAGNVISDHYTWDGFGLIPPVMIPFISRHWADQPSFVCSVLK